MRSGEFNTYLSSFNYQINRTILPVTKPKKGELHESNQT